MNIDNYPFIYAPKLARQSKKRGFTAICGKKIPDIEAINHLKIISTSTVLEIELQVINVFIYDPIRLITHI